MLQRTDPAGDTPAATASRHVDILSVATAVPAHKLGQDDIARRAQKQFPQYARLDGLYANTGIETRYACEPEDWYLEPRGWEITTQFYQRHALDLLEKAASKAVDQAGIEFANVDILITNTVTGLAIPSLDARLMNRLPFRPSVTRMPLFGLGCGAGVAGLASAARMARSGPDLTVLFLTVDLCTFCLRPSDRSLTMFVAAALFGDGAAAVLLRGRDQRGDENSGKTGAARFLTSGEYLWDGTEHIMGWDIKEDGFGVVLSPELLSLLRGRLGEALDAFLEHEGLSLADFDGFLFHPGGRKVLETAQQALGIADGDLAHSWRVLRDYGNMSSPTALFVLKQAIVAGARGRHLLAAFGPGFSAYFVVLEL